MSRNGGYGRRGVEKDAYGLVCAGSVMRRSNEPSISKLPPFLHP